MQVPEEAHAQGGTFDRAQARAAGWTDSALDHALADGRLVALRRGQLVLASHLDRLRGAARHEALLHAAIRAQGEGWHAARRSAAVVHRLPMLGPAPATPLLLREHRTRQERSRTRFQRLAALPPEERDLVRGVPVTTLARTVFDIARSEDLRSAMVVADGALRAGLHPADLAACLARHRGWPGSRAACDVAAFADGRAESPLETLGRVVTRHHDLPVFEPQVQVLLHGEPVARVDGLWREQLLVFEGDGASKLLGGLDPELVARQERSATAGSTSYGRAGTTSTAGTPPGRSGYAAGSPTGPARGSDPGWSCCPPGSASSAHRCPTPTAGPPSSPAPHARVRLSDRNRRRPAYPSARGTAQERRPSDKRPRTRAHRPLSDRNRRRPAYPSARATARERPPSDERTRKLAEADGNRTHQAQILDLTGVEDRGQHQPTARLHRAP